MAQFGNVVCTYGISSRTGACRTQTEAYAPRVQFPAIENVNGLSICAWQVQDELGDTFPAMYCGRECAGAGGFTGQTYYARPLYCHELHDDDYCDVCGGPLT